jgi:hypothetical protein
MVSGSIGDVFAWLVIAAFALVMPIQMSLWADGEANKQGKLTRSQKWLYGSGFIIAAITIGAVIAVLRSQTECPVALLVIYGVIGIAASSLGGLIIGGAINKPYRR